MTVYHPSIAVSLMIRYGSFFARSSAPNPLSAGKELKNVCVCECVCGHELERPKIHMIKRVCASGQREEERRKGEKGWGGTLRVGLDLSWEVEQRTV